MLPFRKDDGVIVAQDGEGSCFDGYFAHYVKFISVVGTSHIHQQYDAFVDGQGMISLCCY